MSDSKFKRAFGVSKKVFNLMLETLKISHEKKHKNGGRPSKVGLDDILFMMLEYWREYRTYFHIAKSRGIAENTCFRNIKWAEDELAKSGVFSLPNRKTVMEDKNITKIIIDATETPIEMPVKSRKKHYSGKKKLYTIKTQLQIDGNTGKILKIETSNGSKHDFKLWKESDKLVKQDIEILADSGYQGIQKIHQKSTIPVKKNGRKS